MPVRMSDVARLAGVSVKTVSNVINDYPHITAGTRARVEAAIAELDYQPNVSARSLRGGRAGVIALAVPELASPYFAEIGAAVSRAARRRGIGVLVEQTEAQADAEHRVFDGLRDRLVDGILFSASGAAPARPGARPIVLLEAPGDLPLLDVVAVDCVRAAYDATVQLAALGRCRIAAIGADPLKRKGYQQALTATGQPVTRALESMSRGDSQADGAAAMRALLSLPEPPDAVFCFSDLLALGALRALAEAGLGVPDDVAVIGFGSIEGGRHYSPTLTTIAPDKNWLAENALTLLLQRIAGTGPRGRCHLTVPHTLRLRESTSGRGPVRQAADALVGGAPGHERPPA